MLDRPPGLALPVPDEVGDILDNEIARPVRAQDAYNIVDQITPLRTLQAVLIARLGEGLTGKAGTEDVVIGDRLNVERPDVAVRAPTEILLVERCKVLIDLAREDALVTERLQRQMKTPQSGK